MARLISNFARDSFKFEKSRQLFFAANDKPFSIVPMRVNNPDCSPVGIES
jgi:hypothetical protein